MYNPVLSNELSGDTDMSFQTPTIDSFFSVTLHTPIFNLETLLFSSEVLLGSTASLFKWPSLFKLSFSQRLQKFLHCVQKLALDFAQLCGSVLICGRRVGHVPVNPVSSVLEPKALSASVNLHLHRGCPQLTFQSSLHSRVNVFMHNLISYLFKNPIYYCLQ